MHTIRTENSFGKQIELTKEQFVKRWREWAFDYYNLVHWSEANEFVANVTKTAEEHFDREAVNKQTKDGAVQLELQF
jgi:hypothetical protein